MKKRRTRMILFVILLVTLGIAYMVFFGSKGRRSEQDMIPEAEVLPGISIQENALNSDRLSEILEGYLEEHTVRREEEDG